MTDTKEKVAPTAPHRNPAWMRVLADMKAAEERDDFDGAEIAQEGLECWRGLDRISARTVFKLHLLMAISHIGQGGRGGLHRYRINETGRKLLAASLRAAASGTRT